ncbi:DUF1015 family protein [Geodermatophilus sabuli]|uniref:DUF1015 family protein n=1 Tax=Geodermatophilus sabuli TaxID=1564158 RepID=UPI001817EAA0|nr:uncharacterized protein (DUF1015 family) [Geodermatophilus sabuli]
MSSPAYDLVTPEGRERLAAADPHNVVRLILPHVPPVAGRPGDDSVQRSAEQSARTLRQWQADGVLARDADPALWVYEMRPADGTPATVGWLGAVALPPAGSRAVLPHEDTYPVAVEGRRALLAATGTDLEPIVLAHDPDPEVPLLTEAARGTEPTLHVADADGVQHRLWRVTDPGLVRGLVGALGRTGAVIADGHHRFAAARANESRAPGAPGAGALLALLTPMGPGGLTVRGIHRVVPDLPLADAVTAAAAGFAVTDVPVGDDGTAAAVQRWLGDPSEEGFLLSDGARLVRLGSPSAQVRACVPPEAPAAWRRLDVVLAHHGLLQALWGRPDDPESVLVAHTVQEALAGAAARHGVAVLLRGPSPADVAAVARTGARMPRKSTLFVPKPRTGLVLRPHAD